MSRDANDEIRATLHELEAHLASWGLRRFTSDDAYFQWQRTLLSPGELSSLHEHVENKRRGSASDEVAFYDATAHPRILPVLYSQRYEYYVAVGRRIAEKIPPAGTVMDFGCGVGVLTTFYAKRFPRISFVGVDRSPVSISRAREQAKALGLDNVRFECLDLITDSLGGSFDVIVASHALVQAEQDLGVPSRDWTTFERLFDVERQRQFEARTGIGPRLDRLGAALSPAGRLILFEKTRQLSRRVPFQRALQARGLSLIEPPESVRYQVVEETTDDGPLYVLRRGESGIAWDESPEPDEGGPLAVPSVKQAAPRGDEPLYENHQASAQQAWQRLHSRAVVEEETRSEPDGRQLHVEWGRADEGCYLYCANTFDQRQLVVVEPERAALLQTYFRDIVDQRSPR